MDEYAKNLLTTKFETEITELRNAGKEDRIISMNGKKYVFGKQIGKGSYGEVYFVKEESTQKFYACKVINKKKFKNLRDASNELYLMKQFNHTHITKLYDAIELWGNGLGDSIYLFMEYAYYGDLRKWLNNRDLTETQAKKVFKQIVLGIEYLHSNGFVHRDLKPSNILMIMVTEKARVVTIADFGLAKKVAYGNNMYFQGGTKGYRAPELCGRTGYSYNAYKADMFSLGKILHDIATNYYKYEMFPDCKTLYEKLTNENPSLRPSATEVLNDPWIASVGNSVRKD